MLEICQTFFFFFISWVTKFTQSYKAISHKTSRKAHLFQYSLSKSLCLKAEVSLIKVLECMRGAKKNDLLVPEKWFLFRHFFLLVFRLKLLVREIIKHPQIRSEVYSKSEKFKVLKSQIKIRDAGFYRTVEQQQKMYADKFSSQPMPHRDKMK